MFVSFDCKDSLALELKSNNIVCDANIIKFFNMYKKR